MVSRIANSENQLFLETNVSFIPFFVFVFWSLLATKLRQYENIMQSLFTFCKARWAICKETHATKVTQIQKTKRRKYRVNETLLVGFENLIDD